MAQVTAEQPKLINRWIIVLGAVMVQFALGAIYSYGFILSPMQKYLDPLGSIFDASTRKMMGLLPFAFALLFFALFMIPAGRWQDKKGPKTVAITGSIIVLAGMILSSVVALAPSGGSIWGMVATFGMIGGAGIGFAYVCPIACATKWFPDKIGLINGLAVAGFGAGSILFNFIYFFMIPKIGGTYRQVDLSSGLLTCGLIMGVMGLVGSFILRNPPAGFKPAGWNPPAPKAGAKTLVESWTTQEMVRTPTFYMIWGMYVMSAICGLMVIGNFKDYGVSFEGSLNAISVYILAIAGVCNAVGRIVWGKLSDKMGRLKTLKILFLVQAASMLLFAIPSIATWAIFGNLVYFCFGGNLALFPATTREFYGAKYMGLNYAVVFTAYGVAGILGALLAGPVIAAMSPDALHPNYGGYFMIFGFMSLASLVISFFTRPPERKT